MKKVIKQERVDVHNDLLMQKLIGRPKNRTPRDIKVWSKTPKEKKILKKSRYSFSKEDNHFHSTPKKFISVYSRLIVFLTKNKQFNKTTYSFMCYQHEIPEILSQFQAKGGRYNLVSKYTWNGKTYKAGEFPYGQ